MQAAYTQIQCLISVTVIYFIQVIRQFLCLDNAMTAKLSKTSVVNYVLMALTVCNFVGDTTVCEDCPDDTETCYGNVLVMDSGYWRRYEGFR